MKLAGNIIEQVTIRNTEKSLHFFYKKKKNAFLRSWLWALSLTQSGLVTGQGQVKGSSTIKAPPPNTETDNNTDT